MTIIDRIPARYRKAVYGVIGGAYAVETALDLVGWGVVDETPQQKIVTVLTALGFGLAFRKTTDVATA